MWTWQFGKVVLTNKKSELVKIPKHLVFHIDLTSKIDCYWSSR